MGVGFCYARVKLHSLKESEYSHIILIKSVLER